MLRSIGRMVAVAALAVASTVGGVAATTTSAHAVDYCSGYQTAGHGIQIDTCLRKAGDIVTSYPSRVKFVSNNRIEFCGVHIFIEQTHPNYTYYQKQQCLGLSTLHRERTLTPETASCTHGHVFTAKIQVRISYVGHPKTFTNFVSAPLTVTCPA